MSRRHNLDTLIAIVDAFHEQRTWIQSELAKRIGVDARTIRAHLELLIQTGRFPLERTVEGKQVYWSLPRNWIPGGLAIAEAEIEPLARLVARAPKGTFRDKILARLLACAPPRAPRPVEPDAITAPPRSELEERMLAHVESSIPARRALAVRYYTASRGEETTRHLSVQRVDAGTPARFIAWCHTAKALRTFRVAHLRGAVPDDGVPYVRVDEEEVRAYVAESINGYHGSAREPVRCRFLVRGPTALWVEHNLPSPMVAARIEGGIEVTVMTAAPDQVARFVVGLGEAARAVTPELREHVRALAEGALRALSDEA